MVGVSVAAAALRSDVRVGVGGVSPFTVVAAALIPRARFGVGSSGVVAGAAGRPRPRGVVVEVGVIPASTQYTL